MMLNIVILYLWAALVFYLLSGGADFGAGITELFSSKRNRPRVREMMRAATGPIWEANHMWLILSIVILFVAFPRTYALISTYFYIPLTLMLIGIIGRGTSYAFRNADGDDVLLNRLDNLIYGISSIATPMFLGMIAGGFFSGAINPSATVFKTAYVDNWFNWFSIATGLFTVSLCTFLAAIYVIGNPKNGEDRFMLVPYALIANILCIVLAIGILFIAKVQEIPISLNPQRSHGLAIGIAISSTILMWLMIGFKLTGLIRQIAALQVFLMQFYIIWDRYPMITNPKHGIGFNISIAQANDKTISMLALALMIGSVLIFPALAFLIYKFEWQAKKK